MLKLLHKLMAPGDSSGGGGGLDIASPLGANLSDKDDIIKLLGDDDETTEIPDEDKITLPKDKKKEGKEKEEADDTEDADSTEDDDDAEGKDKDEDDDEEDVDLESLVDDEPDAEKLALTVPVPRRTILKKYPELFKDFPYLETAYYREQQFTALLPTIEDAQQAVESRQTLDKFEKELMGGKVDTILSAVKAEDGNSFYKIVDNLLPTLAAIDEGAYHHLVGNTIKHTVAAMVAEAKRSKNETLMAAAHVVNQYAFGTSEFQAPTKLAKDDKPADKDKDDSLQQREKEFTRRQFDTARSDINTRVTNSLKAVIEENIDPRQTMTPYVRKNAMREVQETLGKLVKSDKRFGEIVDRLWESAFKQGFTKESTDKIRTAYLSKARTLLPSVIKKARTEALKGMGKRVRDNERSDDEQTDDKPQSKKKLSGGKSESKGVPAGMSTLDFLSS